MLWKEWVKAAGLRPVDTSSAIDGDFCHELEVIFGILQFTDRGKGPHMIKLHQVALMSAMYSLFSWGETGRRYSKAPGKIPGDEISEVRRLCIFNDESLGGLHQITRIAVVPQATQEGDIICVLNGDKRTFVLRQICAQENGCFLVGLCFVSPRFARNYYDKFESIGKETFILY